MANKNNTSPLLDKKPSLIKQDWTQTILSSVISIVIGMIVGSIIILIVGSTNASISTKSTWEAVRLVFFGIFSTGRDAGGNLSFGFNTVNVGDMLFRAMPLILTGLSVAVAFKTGLFNIGAPGQYLLGTAASLFIALNIPSESVSPVIIWILAFLGGGLAGALWGAIPGLLKSLLNVNEVIACIMTNWIAANIVTWFFDVSASLHSQEFGKSGYIRKTSENGVQTSKMLMDKLFPGSQINGGIIIAIIIAVLVYIILNKTTFGYQLKACGSNRFAAKYAGINDKRNIVLSMAIAGALSGFAAALYYLSGNTEFSWNNAYQTLPTAGFNGIPVALLASNNPIAVVFTGIFMSMLNIAGLQIKNLTTYNEYLTEIIIAVIVYLSAFSLLIKMLLSGKIKLGVRKKKTEKVVETAALDNVENTGKEENA